MNVSGTKIAGWLMIGASVLRAVADIFDGNGVQFAEHYDSIVAALAGVGFIRLRTAIGRTEETGTIKQ